MNKITLAHKLKVEWENIYLESKRALNYLNDNSSKPIKGAHKVLAKSVNKSVDKVLSLTR